VGIFPPGKKKINKKKRTKKKKFEEMPVDGKVKNGKKGKKGWVCRRTPLLTVAGAIKNKKENRRLGCTERTPATKDKSKEKKATHTLRGTFPRRGGNIKKEGVNS